MISELEEREIVSGRIRVIISSQDTFVIEHPFVNRSVTVQKLLLQTTKTLVFSRIWETSPAIMGESFQWFSVTGERKHQWSLQFIKISAVLTFTITTWFGTIDISRSHY